MTANNYRNIICSGGDDHFILMWDARTEKPINCSMAHANKITSLRFSEDSTNLLSTGADGFTKIWSIYTGICKSTLCKGNFTIDTYSKFTNNSKYILVSTLTDTISLWDWNKSEIVKSYVGHKNTKCYLESYFINFQGKHKYVITSSEDGKIVIWDTIKQNIVLQ